MIEIAQCMFSSPSVPRKRPKTETNGDAQHLLEAERRSLQEGTRVVGIVFGRCCRLYLRQQQEALRVLFGGYAGTYHKISIRRLPHSQRSQAEDANTWTQQ